MIKSEMNRSIWKFPIPIEYRIGVSMPLGSEILSADFQNTVLCIWALVDVDAATSLRWFRLVGTGHPLPEQDGLELKFVATVQLGSLVFHVFAEVL